MFTNTTYFRLVFAAVVFFPSIAIFSQTIVTVTDSNLNGWQKDEQYLGKIRFARGPLKPPLRHGSLEFHAPVNGHARQVRMRNSDYSGILLSSITHLSYSTYVQKAGSKQDVPLLVLLVDIHGDGKAQRDGIRDGDIPHITFVPRFQNLEDTTGIPTKFGWYKPKKLNDTIIRWQYPIQQNVWQNWDLLHGAWVNWTVVNNTIDTCPSMFSLSSFIAQYPNARIVNDKRGGGIRIQAGGPDMSDNFIGNIDAFTIGINGKTTIYDFELDTNSLGSLHNTGHVPNCTKNSLANKSVFLKGYRE